LATPKCLKKPTPPHALFEFIKKSIPQKQKK